MYLEIMTWHEAGFDNHAIYGSLHELERLANLVNNKLVAAKPGTTITIESEYSSNSPYALILEVREDNFDPAEADPELRNEIGQ